MAPPRHNKQTYIRAQVYMSVYLYILYVNDRV